jgi:hypothetical protein
LNDDWPLQVTETKVVMSFGMQIEGLRIQLGRLASHPSLYAGFRERRLKKLNVAILALAVCLPVSSAFGQQFDAAFGVSSISSPQGITTNGLFFPSDRGGLYPSFGADLLLRHRLGFEGELSWRASQNLYGGSQPYRPLFYSFNAIWAPKLSKNFTAELLAGVGGEDVRFYGFTNCNNFFGCTTYASSNHFMGDFGGGIRAYIWHDVFVRPEARLYLINNNVEFSSNKVVRYGVSLGYSFGGR